MPLNYKTEKQISNHSKYEYELSGEFYIVYTDDSIDYHMAREDEKSLKARIHFYHDFVLKAIERESAEEIFTDDMKIKISLHALGLPYEVITKNDVLLNTDEILSRITFEDGLFFIEDVEEITGIQLGDDSRSMMACTNYLIENGFFFLDLDRLTKDSSYLKNTYFPSFIDEKMIPSSLLAQKETSHKLIMDFASDPFSITKEVFAKYYEPLDRKSLFEKFDYAFNQGNFESEEETNAVFALRRYFAALMLKLINQYYQKNYHIRGIFGFTVLDQDFGYYQNQYRFIYLGVKFDMYASSYRQFEKKEGKVIQSYIPKDFVFDCKDKLLLKQAYDTVKLYFDRHRELSYNPSVFLKMMGVPYPAFEIAKFYDFEHGDSEHFLKLFEFRSDVEYLAQDLYLAFLTMEGVQAFLKSDIFAYSIRALSRKGLFVSNPFCFNCSHEINFLLSFRNVKDAALLKIVKGDVEYYEKAVSEFEKYMQIQIPERENIEQFKTLLLKGRKDGVLKVAADYFSLMNSGCSSSEALDKLEKQYSIDKAFFRALILVVFLVKLKNKTNRVPSSLDEQKLRFNTIKDGEKFTDPYLKYPYVYKGCYFYVYSDGNGNFFMDSDDKKPLEMMQQFYFKHFLNRSYGNFVFNIFSDEIVISPFIYKTGGSRLEALGLPTAFVRTLDYRKDLLSQIHFEDHISIFNDEAHKEMLREDDSLNYLYVFEEALRQGFFLFGKGKKHSQIISLLERDSIYNAYLNTDYFLTLSDERTLDYCFRGIQNKTKLEIKNGSKFLFNYDRNDYLEDKGIYIYGQKFNEALYWSIYEQLFRKNEPRRHYIGYIKLDDLYYAPGKNFPMFSDDGINFGFLKEDVDRLVTISNCFMKFRGINEKKTSFFSYLVSHLGVPDLFKGKMFDIFNEKKTGIEKEDLPCYDKELKVSLKDLPSYEGPFKLSDNYHDLYQSGSFYTRYVALQKGFFVSSSDHIGKEYYSGILSDFKDFREFCWGVLDNWNYLFDDCKDEILDIIHPKEIIFNNRVDAIVKEIREEDNNVILDIDLFYAKEILKYMFHKDKVFIRKLINNKTDKGVKRFGEIGEMILFDPSQDQGMTDSQADACYYIIYRMLDGALDKIYHKYVLRG